VTDTLDIFVKNGPYLKHYANFSSNYDTAIKSLDELYKHQWWSSKAGDRLVFESMLILPIQRIPRYGGGCCGSLICIF
jgi:hypothetical protein